MNIFESIARTFAPKAKPPTIQALEKLLGETETAVETARTAVEALEARRPEAIFAGEEARLAHRSAMTAARDDLADAEAAHAAVVARLEQARVEAAEKGRRAAYDAALAAQKEAQAAITSRYHPAIEELRRLQKLVAQADQLAEIANGDLPLGAERLLEAESCRDALASPERVLSEELVDQWFTTEGGNPVGADRVTSRDGRRGVLYAESSFGPRPVQCELRRVRRVLKQPWTPPSYANRIGDLELPDLKAEPVTPPKPVEELVPLAEIAEAAE